MSVWPACFISLVRVCGAGKIFYDFGRIRVNGRQQAHKFGDYNVRPGEKRWRVGTTDGGTPAMVFYAGGFTGDLEDPRSTVTQ